MFEQVLDRINGVAYVCLSERADAGLAQAWADQLGYEVCPSAQRQCESTAQLDRVVRHVWPRVWLGSCWRTAGRKRDELVTCRSL